MVGFMGDDASIRALILRAHRSGPARPEGPVSVGRSISGPQLEDDEELMPTVYVYVLGASSNPDGVDCAVPWRVDEREIFFGPCKVPLREMLRPQLLRPDRDYVRPDRDIYFVGVNALDSSNP